MDTQFSDSLSYLCHVAQMPIGKTVQAGGDQRPLSLVLELLSPLAKCLRLFHFEHRTV